MNKKLVPIIFGGLVILSIVLVILLLQPKKPNVPQPSPSTSENEEIIPTIDSLTKVSLESLEGKKELKIQVKGIPSGTEVVDYQLSYNTKSQGRQGVIGTITSLKGGSLEKQITLGTCSSGRCVYHEVVGTINTSLKFTGSYGEKIFEKEFTL